MDERSGDLESGGRGQFFLAVVEGPEVLRLEFDCRSDVKSVEGASTEDWDMASSQHSSSFKYCGRQVDQTPQSRIAVLREVPVYGVRHGRGEFAAKDLLRDGMSDLDFMERSQPDPRTLRHSEQCLGGMVVAQIHGRKEARIGVDAQ